MKQFPHTQNDRELIKQNTRKRFWIAVNAIWIALILIGAPIYWKTLADNLEQQAQQNAERYADSVHTHLQRFEVVPHLLAELPEIKESLFPVEGKSRDSLNEKLFNLNKELGTDVVYLINRKGETLASSNYKDEDSFVGENYAFRPYFKDAIEQKEGRYHALGSRSGKLGYYFSAPVHRWDIVAGVIVAKINLEFANNLLAQDMENWFITDKNHIAFLASKEEWLYKAIKPLSQQTRDILTDSRQYGNQTLATITQNSNPNQLTQASHDNLSNTNTQAPELCLQNQAMGRQRCTSFLYGKALLPDEHWSIFSLYSPSSIHRGTLVAIVIVSIAYWLIALIYAYLSNQYFQRRYLAKMNDQLESRLDYLTQDLRHTNSELQDSVTHYREAKEELERTQDELIQTEKLAVLGEVAVGLNHELNQPLLAIKAYSDNAREFLLRDNLDSAKENLREINRVTETMAMIISRFRVFSRKNTSATVVEVTSAIEGALVIFMPRARNQKINVINSFGEQETAKVFCDQIQLQQVIINLLANAAQAMENQAEQIIEIALEINSGTVKIKIADNGPGLEDIKSDQLFTPFYTTKPQGLGLGLSLSKRIIETFDGDITFRESRFGGTEFEISLPIHQQ